MLLSRGRRPGSRRGRGTGRKGSSPCGRRAPRVASTYSAAMSSPANAINVAPSVFDPSASPSRNPSFASPMPEAAGEERGEGEEEAAERKPRQEVRERIDPGALAATISPTARLAGRTIAFGSSRCFTSIAASRTSVGQKTAPRSAWPRAARSGRSSPRRRRAPPLRRSRADVPVGSSSESGRRSTAADSATGSGWAAGSGTGIVGTLISAVERVEDGDDGRARG